MQQKIKPTCFHYMLPLLYQTCAEENTQTFILNTQSFGTLLLCLQNVENSTIASFGITVANYITTELWYYSAYVECDT